MRKYTICSIAAFELTQGQLYAMTLDFTPNNALEYDAEDREYELAPNIKIVSTSLVGGPFSVSGLIEGENVVAQLNPDGTFKMLSTYLPNAELQGIYFFNYATRILHLDLKNVVCATCVGVGAIPGGIFYNLPNSDITVTTWNATTIVGTVGQGLVSRSVTFTQTGAFALATSTGYTVMNVVASYPAGYDGKFGVLTLSAQRGPARAFVDIQTIQNSQAIFSFKIPYSELPGGIPGGSRAYVATPIVAANLTDLKISAGGSICGTVSLSAVNYAINAVVADKAMTTSLSFVPIP